MSLSCLASQSTKIHAILVLVLIYMFTSSLSQADGKSRLASNRNSFTIFDPVKSFSHVTHSAVNSAAVIDLINNSFSNP